MDKNIKSDVEPVLQDVTVTQLVPLFLENGSKDFLETWHEVRDQKSKQSDRARFSKKNPDFVKSAILCPKMRFFGLFSKSALTILLIFCQTVEENDTDQQEKKLGQKIPYFSRYGLSKLGKICPFAMTSAWLIQHEFFFGESIIAFLSNSHE